MLKLSDGLRQKILKTLEGKTKMRTRHRMTPDNRFRGESAIGQGPRTDRCR